MSEPVVLIISCDQFSDVWDAALHCLNKYWDDCPFVVRTLSNHKPWGKNPLLVGDDRGWVNNLKTALDQIDSPFVISWLDDMLLCRKTDTFWIRAVAELLMSYGQELAAIRLGQGNETQGGGFVSALLDRFIAPVTISSDYRISTSPTFWRTNYLRQILDNCGDTAWDFESKGTVFSRTLPGVIAVPNGADDTTRPIRQYYTGITRGKWNRGCLNWLERTEGIVVADTSRGIIENEREP